MKPDELKKDLSSVIQNPVEPPLNLVEEKSELSKFDEFIKEIKGYLLSVNENDRRTLKIYMEAGIINFGGIVFGHVTPENPIFRVWNNGEPGDLEASIIRKYPNTNIGAAIELARFLAKKYNYKDQQSDQLNKEDKEFYDSLDKSDPELRVVHFLSDVFK